MKKFLFTVIVLTAILNACSKSPVSSRSQLDDQSSELVIDWTNVQLRLIRNTTGVTHVAYSRHFAYTGVAIYESLVNGDNKYRSIQPVLNGSIIIPQLPEGNHVFFPAAANAAFGDMLRFFYGTKQTNTVIIDSLESVYKNKYATTVTNNFSIDESVQYGKAIATAVIEWCKLDNSSNSATVYTALCEGYWEPTAPAFAAPAVPGWGNNKTIIKGSIDNTAAQAPIPFSRNPGSSFYEMVKELYTISQSLNDEQKATASFWDDAPNGKYLTAFGHWFSILKQVLKNEKTPLMVAADAYLRLGISLNESSISCWRSKYSFSQMRPITYIRKYMGNETWNPFITTPPHPEYLAAHATISAAAAYALESVFGNNYSFTDHTYDDLGMNARRYNSFEAAGNEAGISRLYGGIHYRPSIEAGKIQGDKVGENVKNILTTIK